jgi:hypothetical protein
VRRLPQRGEGDRRGELRAALPLAAEPPGVRELYGACMGERDGTSPPLGAWGEERNAPAVGVVVATDADGAGRDPC